jgi:hypothetical protein
MGRAESETTTVDEAKKKFNIKKSNAEWYCVGGLELKKSQNIYVSKPLIRLDDTFSSRPTRVEQKPSKRRRRSRANKSIFYNLVFVLFFEGFLAKKYREMKRKN